MTDNEVIKKRLIELSRRAYDTGADIYTDFLSMAEQSTLASVKQELYSPYLLYGGAGERERRVARFGTDTDDTAKFPIACLMISPRSAKFAQKLSHRDYLGALMSIGLDRSKLGDIVIDGSNAYVFCRDEMKEFIARSVDSVARTSVKCEIVDSIPEHMTDETHEITVQVASIRLDALVAKVYRLSREESSSLIKQGRVYVNAVLCESPSREPKDEDIVSVRGFGRFKLLGKAGTGKKGKVNVLIARFGRG